MTLEKSNLNSDDRLRQQNTSSSCSWSELPSDLLTLVLERLGFADFERAKFVCTSWHSASRQSVPRNLFPWLIIFPQDGDDKNNKNNACKLFNPEEKDKIYKTRVLGLEFASSVCVATCGSWLLMQDSRLNLYIVNLFTNDEKIIKLPPLDSQHGTIKVEGSFEDGFCFTNERNQRKEEYKWIQIKSPVFWIDEKTKDYVVISGLQDWCVVYAKKGHTSWNQLPKTSCCFDMVYKDHKLYFSSCRRRVLKIFDFSRKIPKLTFRCRLRIYRDLECKFIFRGYSKLVVTLAGDVLKVDRIIRRRFDSSTFFVYRVYSSRSFKKYEQVDSLGDEAMLWNMGITVLANDKEGFKRNSIYFNGSNKEKTTETCIFNLEKRKMEPQHNFDWSSVRQVGRARWFLPSFKRQCY